MVMVNIKITPKCRTCKNNNDCLHNAIFGGVFAICPIEEEIVELCRSYTKAVLDDVSLSKRNI